MKSTHGCYLYYYYFYQNVSSHVIIIILLLIFTQSINYIESYHHHQHQHHHYPSHPQQQSDEPMKLDLTNYYNTDNQQLTSTSYDEKDKFDNQLSSSIPPDGDLNSYTNGLPDFSVLNPSPSSPTSFSSLESSSTSPTSTILNLQGTFNSFAQFKSWIINRDQHLQSSQPQLPNFSLSFRTHEPNSLIVYSQSANCCDYIELKLIEGVLRLRYNLTAGSSVITIGRNLYDYQWHLIEIIINKESLILKIDDEMSSSRSLRPSADHQIEKSTKMDYLFIGGFPVNSYPSEFVNLHLPWILFEPTYRGQIKNIIYQSDDENNLISGSSVNQHRQEPIKWIGLRRDTSEPCSDSDPCNHGGTCINTDSGPECDCRGLDYVGDHCDKPKHSPEATFRGQEFIYFNNISKSILSSSDEISLYFKTRQSNGLLFYAGDGISDYLNLAIRDGGVTLSVKLGNNLSERIVKPPRIRFDDNQWHKVLVHRKVREMNRAISFCHFSITIDGVYTERGSTTGSFSLLSSSILFIGGSDHFEQLPGSRVQSNFIGCLRKVEFIGDSMVLDILDLAKSDLNLFQVKGNIVDSCQEVEAADPITFTTKDSFLALPRWEAIKGGSLSLKIRTNEPNGVLMYSSGGINGNSFSSTSSVSSPSFSLASTSSTSSGSSLHPPGPSDFFALELLDGQIYLLLNLGSGPIKVKASARRVDDSHWHVITLLRTAKSGRVTVDDAAVDFITPGTNNQLDLDSPLYLGSFGPSLRKAFNEVPPELWAGSLKYGYVGCVRDLVLNNQAIDIASFARKQDSGSVKPSCHSLPSHCDKKPCFNEGICMEGWNRFVCDCRATSYTGPVCTKDATTLNFNGEDYMLIDLGEEVTTQAEDFNLRFKTTTSTSFLLMASSTERFSSYLIISLEGGRLKVTINLGEGNKVTYIGNGLGNDRWHTIRIYRRGPSLEVKCDSENVITELTGQLINLHYSNLVIGSYIDLRPGAVRSALLSSGSSPGTNKEAPNFVGSMQNLILNGNDYIDLSKQGIDLNFTVTATYGKKDGSVHRPITFKSRRTYIGLPQLKAYSTMALYFQFKTNLPNGLILFNGGKDDDFIAVEMVAGQLHYTFNMGDGPRRLKSSTRYSLNDGQWHSVAVGRPSLGQHTLMVDDMVSSFTNAGPNLHLDLTGLLYLGGLPNEMYSTLPTLVVSNHGFEGCLASLDFNGETIDPTGPDAVVRSTLVSKGCSGEGSVECTPGSKEDGSCDSLIGLGSPINCIPTDDCPCDDNQSPLSSLSSKCSHSLGSASYQWSLKGGLILFTFPDKKLDTKNDHLSITFSTESDNCVLFRVDSGSSNDYMELSIFDGTILMVYNLGTEDHDIGQLDVKVNDGKVHSVRFARIGPNSTIQVDNHNVVRKTPSGGRQLTVFNSHHKIQIGGKMNTAKEHLEKPFIGIISGLLYDGYRLLDLAMDGDPRIEIKGDVLLVTSKGKSFRKESKGKPGEQSNPEENLIENSSNKENTDSLIFSGEGSGDCFDGNDDDDDGCEIKTVKETEVDELITPKFIESNAKPSPASTSDLGASWSSVTTESSAIRPCNPDVEDCFGLSYNRAISSTVGLTKKVPSTTSFPETLGHFPPSTSTSISPWVEPERSTYGWYPHVISSTLSPTRLYPKISPIQHVPMRPKPQTPTRPTGRPPIIDVPRHNPHPPLEKPIQPTINQQDKPKSKTTGPSADYTALLIGLVAITSIIIVVITPMIFYSYTRYQNDRYYKGQPGNGGDPNRVKFNLITGVPTIITNEVNLDGSNMYHGSSRSNVSHIITPETSKNSKKKDNREWYV